MNSSRVHACLDGELPRHELSGGEAVKLASLERDLAPVIASLSASAGVDLRSEVMRCLPEAAPAQSCVEGTRAAVKLGWRWFWTPRPLTLQWRPSLVLAAMVVALLVAQPWDAVVDTETPQLQIVAPPADQPIFVQFRLDAAHVSSVSVAGSFSGWQPTIKLRESAPGLWTAVVPLTPGVHDYLFLIDRAEWVADPSARAVEDGFGGVNSRLFLTLSSAAL